MALLIVVDQWSAPPLKETTRQHVETIARSLISQGDALWADHGYDPPRLSGNRAAVKETEGDRISIRYRRDSGEGAIKVVVNYFVPTETFFIPVEQPERSRLDEGWDDIHGG